jgi:hypothetical protein
MKGFFIGINEGMRFFGSFPSVPELKNLEHIPFSKELLQRSAASHVLIAVPSMPLFDTLKHIQADAGLIRKSTYKWISENKDESPALFAHGLSSDGWHLVALAPLPGSTNVTLEGQSALIQSWQRVPTAHTLAHAMLGIRYKTGASPFGESAVRTGSFSLQPEQKTEPSRVIVRFFDSHFECKVELNSARYPKLGLGVEIMPGTELGQIPESYFKQLEESL